MPAVTGRHKYVPSSRLLSILIMNTTNISLVCGYLFVGMSDDEYPFRSLLSGFLFTTLALNAFVTSLMGMHMLFPSRTRRFDKSLILLIAGRIWWIARKTRGLVGPKLTRKYRMVVVIL